MSSRQRILALRLLEKQKKHPEYMKKLGIEVKVNESNNKCFIKEDFKYISSSSTNCSKYTNLAFFV